MSNCNQEKQLIEFFRNINEENEKIMKEKSIKYQFDFSTEKPLSNKNKIKILLIPKNRETSKEFIDLEFQNVNFNQNCFENNFAFFRQEVLSRIQK